MKRKILSLILCAFMCISALASCSDSSSGADAFVIMTEQLDGLFNPFFYTAAADGTIVGMTQIGMLGSTYENGDVKVAFGKDHAVAVLDYFMNDAVAVSGLKGQDGTTYAGKSYYIEPKEVICSVLVESASQKTAIVFAKVKFVVPGVTIENAATPAFVGFNADILANALTAQGDFAVLKAAA